jgi:hypothetical protein
VLQRHEARFKEAGLSSSQPLESEGALAAQPSQSGANRRGERSGKSAASDARPGASASRLSNTAAVAVTDERLSHSPTGSPTGSLKGGKRRHPKLDTVDEDAESGGTSAEGEEEQTDSLPDAAAPPEPSLADEVMGEGGSAREPRGKPKSAQGESDRVATDLVAFCTQFANGTSRSPPPPSASTHGGGASQGGASRTLSSQLAAPSASSAALSQHAAFLPHNLPAGAALSPGGSSASQSSDSSAGVKRGERDDDDPQVRFSRVSAGDVLNSRGGVGLSSTQAAPAHKPMG